MRAPRVKRLLTALAGISVAAMTVVVATPVSGFAAPRTAGNQACLVGSPPAGSVIPSPFLKLPFRQADGKLSLWDSEAWLTSPDELAIDGEVNGDLHAANDLEFVNKPDYGYGLPVLAAADGRAYFSYQYTSGIWTDPATGITHQVGWGAGLFVEIRHAKDQPGNRGWVTQYIHLSKVAPGLPYLKPDAVSDPADPTHPDWFPTGILKEDNALWNVGVPVKQGQVIGYQGDTGIGFGWKDNFDPATGQVAPRNRAVLKPWDPPQLHFQLYQGRVNGVKQNIVDPFGLYSQVCPGEWSPLHTNVNPYTPVPGQVRTAPVSAFLTDRTGQPEYAG